MNNQAKHTPGPWKTSIDYGRNPGSVIDASVLAPNGSEIARMIHANAAISQAAESNANLIAAAPDLLEAAKEALPNLRWAETHLDGNSLAWRELIAKFESLIAKAEGRS